MFPFIERCCRNTDAKPKPSAAATANHLTSCWHLHCTGGWATPLWATAQHSTPPSGTSQSTHHPREGGPIRPQPRLTHKPSAHQGPGEHTDPTQGPLTTGNPTGLAPWPPQVRGRFRSPAACTSPISSLPGCSSFLEFPCLTQPAAMSLEGPTPHPGWGTPVPWPALRARSTDPLSYWPFSALGARANHSTSIFLRAFFFFIKKKKIQL